MYQTIYKYLCKVSGIFYICRRRAQCCMAERNENENETKIRTSTLRIRNQSRILDWMIRRKISSNHPPIEKSVRGGWGTGDTLKSVGVSICMHRGNKSRNNIYTFVLCCICHVTIKETHSTGPKPSEISEKQPLPRRLDQFSPPSMWLARKHPLAL